MEICCHWSGCKWSVEFQIWLLFSQDMLSHKLDSISIMCCVYYVYGKSFFSQQHYLLMQTQGHKQRDRGQHDCKLDVRQMWNKEVGLQVFKIFSDMFKQTELRCMNYWTHAVSWFYSFSGSFHQCRWTSVVAPLALSLFFTCVTER